MFYPTTDGSTALDSDSPYLSRDEVAQPSSDPFRDQVQGFEQQIAARHQMLQQPLAPEGTTLKREFTADLDHIRDMQASGYPPQHMADYMNQWLSKFDSRWSPAYVQKQSSFDDIVNKITGIIPVTGTPGHISYRSGKPQINEFDSQKNAADETEAPPEAAATPTEAAGMSRNQLLASNLPLATDLEGGGLDQPSTVNLPATVPPAAGPVQGLVVGQPVPPGANLPDYRTWDKISPGAFYKYGNIVQKKPTQEEWDAKMQREHFGDEHYELLEKHKVPRKVDPKSGKWVIDKDVWAVQKAIADKQEKAQAELTKKQEKARAELVKKQEKAEHERVAREQKATAKPDVSKMTFEEYMADPVRREKMLQAAIANIMSVSGASPPTRDQAWEEARRNFESDQKQLGKKTPITPGRLEWAKQYVSGYKTNPEFRAVVDPDSLAHALEILEQEGKSGTSPPAAPPPAAQSDVSLPPLPPGSAPSVTTPPLPPLAAPADATPPAVPSTTKAPTTEVGPIAPQGPQPSQPSVGKPMSVMAAEATLRKYKAVYGKDIPANKRDGYDAAVAIYRQWAESQKR